MVHSRVPQIGLKRIYVNVFGLLREGSCVEFRVQGWGLGSTSILIFLPWERALAFNGALATSSNP